MLQYQWTNTTIVTNQQANACMSLFDSINPEAGAFDTETTGLNIKMDIPFLFQFGWIDPTTMKGYTFVLDLERQPDLARQVIIAWHKRAATLKIYLAHNIKFDLHMLSNINLPYFVQNVSDTMFYIRYGHDALQPKEGGPPLKLKDYTVRYIDHRAKTHEKLIAKEKTEKAKEINLKLKIRLQVCGKPPAKYTAKSYTLSVIEDMFKDPIAGIDELPDKVKQIYLEWLQQDVPIYLQRITTGLVDSDQIPYNTLNRQTVIMYAHYDIVYVLEVYAFLDRVVKARENMFGIELENKLIYPFWRMERTGFRADKQYLLESQKRLKDYIIKKRSELYHCCDVKFKIGQHEVIKNILNTDFDLDITSTNATELDLVLSKLKREGNNPNAVHVIELLQELRTLEKWYSAYIVRFLNNLHDTDRLYTQINQVGTVSVRVTSDFQQFPRKPINDNEGNELFHPRKMVLVEKGNCNETIYLDYSQIELRFQGIYTILVGDPDLNLCRAYMPYKCINNQGELFDYTNPEHMSTWDQDWFYEEEPTKHWIPTDVHGVTTKEAFGVTEDDHQFEALRYDGKKVNFAKNYGAGFDKVCAMFPTRTPEECHLINDSYYKAYPGIKTYHQYCIGRAKCYSYTSNLFGIKYYGVSGHKLKNILVQGSAAVFLKLKIIEIDQYMQDYHMESQLQMQIHDELSWLKHKDEMHHFYKIKKIMETWDDALVPIVADMEISSTSWADKRKVL